jgi:hypothetical protein
MNGISILSAGSSSLSKAGAGGGRNVLMFTLAVIFLFSSLNNSAFVLNLTLSPLKYPTLSSSPFNFK